MSKIDYENLLNPVGSVYFDYDYEKNKTGRKRGQWDVTMDNVEDINPYKDAVQQRNITQDQFRTYQNELVTWEADYQNWLMQLKVDEALKLEQREYDSPEERIRRDREAGINSDIAGASAGASAGGSGAVAAATKPRSSTPSADAYADKRFTLDCINVAMNSLSQFAALGQSVTDMIKTYQMLPSEVSLSETQAYVADNTKDFVIQAAEQGVEQQALAIEGQKISNSNSLINQQRNHIGYVGDMAQYTTPEFTDEDYTDLFDLHNVPEEQRDLLKKNIKTFNKNPQAQADYEENKRKLNEHAAYNKVFTREVLTKFANKSRRIETLKLDLEEDMTDIKADMARVLEAYSYGDKVANTLVNEADLRGENVQFMKRKLEDDITAYGKKLTNIATQIADLKKKQKKLEVYDGVMARAAHEANELLIQELETMSSDKLEDAIRLLNKANRNYYRYEHQAQYGGYGMEPYKVKKAGLDYQEMLFTDIVDRAVAGEDISSTITNYLISQIPVVGDVAAQIVK